MFRKKLMGVLLAGAVLAASAGLTVPNALSASAQTQLDTSTASLFLPESYEQYLSLEDPVDIAVCGRYIAIAEQDTLYLFDRSETTPIYHTYKHNEVHNQAKISKIQFSDTETLYLSDSLLGFYQLDLTSLTDIKPTTEQPITSLSTFYIEENTLFEVSVVTEGTTYLTAPLSEPEKAKQFFHNTYKNTPQLGYSNGNFYSIVGTLVTVYSNAGGTYQATENMTLQTALSSLEAATVVGNNIFYTVNDPSNVENGLYRFDLTTKSSTLLFEGDGFGALTSYNGKLYAVKGNGVMEYSLENGIQKTDFEISSASDSVNRLNTATDSARAGDLLVTADAGNHRLSVYDMKKDTYTVLSLSYAPAFVATDGEIIAAAADSMIYIYTWNNRSKHYERVFDYNAEYPVTGLSCLYGTCYFVTNGFSYGVIGADAEGKYALEGPQIRTTLGQSPPAALTNDLYGNLYVALNDGSVFRYTEESFAEKNIAQGERLETTLPTGFSCVRADFEGHLYCLIGNTLYQDGSPLASIDGKNFVYSKDGASLSPLSFALGFEDDAVYFNFGNFMVKTAAGALGFPTLSTIDATGIYEELQKVHTPEEVRHMDVKKGAVGIEVDLSSLGEDTDCFPFHAYQRTADSYRGALLAEKENYLLIALYHDKGYDVRLFRKEQCTEAETETMESAGEKFLSSSCNLYHYPCIADAASEALPRGTRVKVLSVVKADPDSAAPDLGYDFAYIEVESKARETKRGYVPLSFLTDADPAGSGSEEFEIVKLKQDTVFTDGSGEKTLSKGTEVKLYTDEDGNYTGRFTDEAGKVWSQQLTEEMIYRGESDALRIALIVVLSVLALVIIGAYFALLPHEKKR